MLGQILCVMFLSFLIMVLILCFTKLRITIESHRLGENDRLKLTITAWFKLINIQTTIPFVKLKENLRGLEYEVDTQSSRNELDEKESSMSFTDLVHRIQRLQEFIQRVYHWHDIAKKLLKGIYLYRLDWKIEIGTGDAAETGVLTGISWGVLSSIIGLFTSYVTLRTIPSIMVQPAFQQKKLETEFRCMFRFRIGNAILAGIRLVLNLRKRRDVKWQSTQFRA